MDIAWFTLRNGAYERTSHEACKHLEQVKLDMSLGAPGRTTLICEGRIGYSGVFEDELGPCRVFCHNFFDYFEMRGTELYRAWKKIVCVGIPASPGYDACSETFKTFIDELRNYAVDKRRMK